MSIKNKKQFGVWMDSQHATVVGRENTEAGNFIILAHENASGQESNSNENAGNNAEKSSGNKFFKNITSHMQNVDEIHVTGTGVSQEQFIKYLGATPQYKNAVATETTSNRMSDESLIKFVTEHFGK